jgi:predicted pyridoxine 5'-phosphate oxidase superfamily flavin-nucleotide-binding protein
VTVLSSDVAFSPAVKAVQSRRGSRGAHAKVEARGGFRTRVTPDLVAFLAGVDTAFLATASAAGQPYAQHRGGPKGFIRALDERTLAFADFSGNRQYISTGNLSENSKAFLFLMDYAHRHRIKLWGRARVVEDLDFEASLMPEGYEARPPEQAVLFSVDAWAVNCPQHVPQKIDAIEVAELVRCLHARIAELEAENARLVDDASGRQDPSSAREAVAPSGSRDARGRSRAERTGSTE